MVTLVGLGLKVLIKLILENIFEAWSTVDLFQLKMLTDIVEMKNRYCFLWSTINGQQTFQRTTKVLHSSVKGFLNTNGAWQRYWEIAKPNTFWKPVQIASTEASFENSSAIALAVFDNSL
jgi:hypothetical protein